jgi:hypothetical protein
MKDREVLVIRYEDGSEVDPDVSRTMGGKQ